MSCKAACHAANGIIFFPQGMCVCVLVSAILWIFNDAPDSTKLISQGVTFFWTWAPKSNFSLINGLSEEPGVLLCSCRTGPGPGGDGQTYPSHHRSGVCSHSSAKATKGQGCWTPSSNTIHLKTCPGRSKHLISLSEKCTSNYWWK